VFTGRDERTPTATGSARVLEQAAAHPGPTGFDVPRVAIAAARPVAKDLAASPDTAAAKMSVRVTGSGRGAEAGPTTRTWANPIARNVHRRHHALLEGVGGLPDATFTFGISIA
jgi:hypothetical protein